MNAVTLALLWCVVQVTLLTLLTIGFYYTLRRLGPQVGGAVALSTVAMIVALSLLAFSPWPRWTSFASQNAGLAAASPNEERVSSSTSPTTQTTGDALEPMGSTALAAESAGPTFWDALADEVSRVSTVSDGPNGPAWPIILAVLVIAGTILGTARLVFGLMAVRRYRRQSTLIDDPRATETLDVLLAEIGCRRRPEMRESDAFFSAATVGWRRPVILLPTAWRKWNDQQLRAVLAHEIAHIQGGDALACLLAQVALALHFYHPLVHWLVARLRLEQELAADGVAAEFSGGRQSYLKTLAAMALDQEDKNVVWPARAFVPARTAFLRRIVVLRNFHQPIRATSARSRVVAIACVILAGLAVVGLRPPARGQVPAQALTENDALPSSTPAATIDLSYVPDDTLTVAAFRPARILRQARQLGLEKLVTRGAEASGIDQLLLGDIGLEKVQQLSFYGLLVPGDSVLLHLNEAAKLSDWLPKAEKKSRAGREVFVWNRRAYLQLDDRTIASCSPPDGQLLDRLLSLKPGKGPAFLSKEKWEPTASEDCVFAYHHALMNAVVSNPANNANISPPFLASLFETPMNEVKSLVLTLRLEGDLKADAILFCKSDDTAARVRETVEAYEILGRNAILEQLSSMQDMDEVRNAAQQFFDSLQVDNQGRVVLAKATLALTGGWPHSLLPQLKAAEQAAQRTGSANKLKRLGLAMHIYYDAHKRLPAATLLGPDGKTPYSWRVAILPMIGEQALYDRYRFDEPWDGPNNRKLLAEMPDEYRHPAAPADSQNACYFALTGPETIFPKEGIAFRDIKDGMSNTLMLVEARRDIPWTKPEDIPYASDKPIPKLGGFNEGGFHAVFCDGSAQFLTDALQGTTFRGIATRAGGEVFEYRDK